jgi:hypothetical protein
VLACRLLGSFQVRLQLGGAMGFRPIAQTEQFVSLRAADARRVEDRPESKGHGGPFSGLSALLTAALLTDSPLSCVCLTMSAWLSP